MGESSLLLLRKEPMGKTEDQSNSKFLSALFFVLIFIGAAALSVSVPLHSYQSSLSSGDFVVHEDKDTKLTELYGVDKDGNYRLYVRGEYLLNVSGSNWNYLNIENTANDNDADYLQTMRAVGYLEGYLTCAHMREYYLNFMHAMFEGALPNSQTKQFLINNYKWVSEQSSQRYQTDDYWMSVRGIVMQLQGMLAGLKRGCPCSGDCTNELDLWNLDNPTMLHLLLLNADGDLYQITEKYFTFKSGNTGQRRHRRRMLFNRRNAEGSSDAPPEDSPPSDVDSHARHGFGYDNHCSAMIKLLSNHSDILFGHDTWDTFESASPRIIKRFRLYQFTRSKVLVSNWGQPIVGDLSHMSNVGPPKITEATAASRWGSSTHLNGENDDNNVGIDIIQDLIFSSSPGFLASVDDFYLTSGGHGNLMVTETSLDIYSAPLVEQIHPQSVLCWMRAIVANSMAYSGPEWSWWFSVYHSGTYVNQWMVIDTNRFVPNESPLQHGLLTVLEEMPGLVHSEDKTSYLQEFGYWASYNLPYYDDILYYSGAAQLCNANPEMNCFSTDPRAQLFRAHQENVSSLEMFMELMTSNNYETDPLSLGDPCNAISCRQDLEGNPWIRDPFGGIDSKVTTLNSCTGRWGSYTERPAGDVVDTSMVGKRKNNRANNLRKYHDSQPLSSYPIPPSSNFVWARNGPTHSNILDPFCWSSFSGGYGIWKETEADFSHVGHPNCYNFDWQAFPPQRDHEY